MTTQHDPVRFRTRFASVYTHKDSPNTLRGRFPIQFDPTLRNREQKNTEEIQ